jgi:hypothetical protein
MKMILNYCSLVGGPLGGRRVLFVRQPENRITPESWFFRLGKAGDCYRYDQEGQNEQDGSLFFGYVGVDADDADDAADVFTEHCSETAFPDDKTPAKKTRIFFFQGPFDGGFVFVLYPPDLVFGGVDMAMEWLDDDGAPQQSSLVCDYAPRPAWREDEGLADDEMAAPDTLAYEWAGTRKAAAK